MKKFFKENKIAIVVYIVMLILIGLGVREYNRDYGYQKRIEQHKNTIEKCQQYDYSTLTREERELIVNACQELENKEVKMDDTITTFFYILYTKKLYYLHLIIPILIIICSVKKWHSYIKNGVIKNTLTREKYSKCLKKEFLDSYKQVAVFLGFILLIFLISFVISVHFDYTEALSFDGLVEHDFYKTMPYSLIMFFIILGLSYFMYINISLISAKYNKNYYVCVIVSYLIWLALNILVEVLIGGYLCRLFLKLPIGQTFSLLALYVTWTTKEQLIQFGLTLTLTILSFVALYLVYHKKEGVVMACEK